MKNNRPEGWDNPYASRSQTVSNIWYARIYEEGAGAILEKLKETGLYGKYLEDFIVSARVKKDGLDWAGSFFKGITSKGWLVFIEESTDDRVRAEEGEAVGCGEEVVWSHKGYPSSQGR